MEVCNDAILGLNLLYSSSTSQQFYNSFVSAVNLIAGTKDTEHCDKDSNGMENIDSNVLKQGEFGIYTLIIEAARYNCSADDLVNLFVKLKFDINLVKKIVDLYCEHVELIRARLSQIGIESSHLTAVMWRLDYRVKNCTVEKIHDLLFFVKLEMEKQNEEIDYIQFVCSIEELQDLSWKLRECARAVERLTRS